MGTLKKIFGAWLISRGGRRIVKSTIEDSVISSLKDFTIGSFEATEGYKIFRDKTGDEVQDTESVGYPLGGTTEENVAYVNDNNFATEVLNAEIPVLVYFWAPWCTPCHTINRVIGGLSSRESLKVAKFNVDENHTISCQFGVKGIPTFILFKNGKVLEQIVGAVPIERLAAMIERTL